MRLSTIIAGALLAAVVSDAQAALPPHTLVSHTYLVFFQSGRDQLTPEGREILRDAALAARDMPDVRLRVMVSSEGRNSQSLSERRADAVKDELVRDGVKPNVIVANGQPAELIYADLDPTVRQWLDRRAVIELSEGAAS